MLALVAAVVVRWRHRAFFVFLIVVGMVLAVGSHPYAAPSTVGALIKTFMTKTTAGLALRSTDRATPMVLLGLAMLLGAGITALPRRRRLMGIGRDGAGTGAGRGGQPAGVERQHRARPLHVPHPAAELRHPGGQAPSTPSTRRPGCSPSRARTSAAYRYGDTVDPIWPGLLTRPFVTREQLALGSLPSYDMLYALDDPMQNRTADPAALAPMARLMSAGDVLVQNDLAYELYDRPPPQLFWQSLDLPQAGLGRPVGYGTPRPNVSPHPRGRRGRAGRRARRCVAAPLEVLAVAESPTHRAGRVRPGGARRGRRRRGARRPRPGLGLLDTDAARPLRRHARHPPHGAAAARWRAGPRWC